MADLELGLPFLCPKLGGIPMFKFGCSIVIELRDAVAFARIFGLKTDRPTLRKIARASAICYHHLVKSEDVCTFLVRSQN